MSYDDKALRISHALPAITVGSAQTQSIQGPSGRYGRVVSVAATVTTTIVGASTAVKVGVAADDDKFMTLSLGALTAPEARSTDTLARPSAGIPANIAKDEEVVVTHAAGTSGVYATTVTVDWF